jgi:uncharacterized protein (TIGR02118 family)
MIKITVLYGHPSDPAAFESYYLATHMPIAAKMTGVARVELTKFFPGPDGSPPAYYRMAELYFASAEAMKATMASPGGQATLQDLPRFATGGVTVLAGTVS